MGTLANDLNFKIVTCLICKVGIIKKYFMGLIGLQIIYVKYPA